MNTFCVVLSFLIVLCISSDSCLAQKEYKSEVRVKSTPFQTINSCSISRNGFLICTGVTAPNNNNVAATSENRVTSSAVWQTRSNITSEFTVAWASEQDRTRNITANYNVVSTRKHNLNLDQNILILGEQGNPNLTLLVYGWLNPLTTPERNNNTVRRASLPIGITAIDKMTNLDNRGGVYVTSSGLLAWIPVIAPFSTDPPLDNGPTAALIRNFTGIITAVTLLSDFNTMYVSEYIANTHRIWRLTVNGNEAVPDNRVTNYLELGSSSKPPISNAVNGVSSLAANPNNGDVYIGLGNGGRKTLIFSSTAQLIGSINHNFPNIRAIDMDTNGQYLFIAGDNGANVGALDVLNLPLNNLSPNYGADASRLMKTWTFGLSFMIIFISLFIVL